MTFNIPPGTASTYWNESDTGTFTGDRITYISTPYVTITVRRDWAASPVPQQRVEPAFRMRRHPSAPSFPAADREALTRRYWAIGEARKLGQVEPEPKPLPSRLTRPARRADWIVHRMRDPQRRGTSRTTRWASE